MKVTEKRDEQGNLRGLEVSSDISRRRMAKLLAKIPGLQVTKVTSGFSFNFIVPNLDELVCDFTFLGIAYDVTEDFGDSDRYWIGPKDRQLRSETEQLLQHMLSL